MFCDFKSAIYIIENPVFHDRKRHIELNCHIIRDGCLADIIKPFGTSLQKQLGDIFTKPLAVARFKSLIKQLAVFNCYKVQACEGGLKKKFEVREMEVGKNRRVKTKNKEGKCKIVRFEPESQRE